MRARRGHRADSEHPGKHPGKLSADAPGWKGLSNGQDLAKAAPECQAPMEEDLPLTSEGPASAALPLLLQLGQI